MVLGCPLEISLFPLLLSARQKIGKEVIEVSYIDVDRFINYIRIFQFIHFSSENTCNFSQNKVHLFLETRAEQAPAASEMFTTHIIRSNGGDDGYNTNSIINNHPTFSAVYGLRTSWPWQAQRIVPR
jgi:hypothetical protein